MNDRPYVASSFLSVAIAKVFGTALSGRSKATTGARRDAAAARGAPAGRRRAAAARSSRASCSNRSATRSATAAIPLDATIPDWGDSRYLDVTLRGRVLLRDLLEHLYVLLPVLDDDKHYWVERERDRQAARQGRRLARAIIPSAS